jgi:lipopolysaccharide transport system ATP-binding protein
MGSIAVNKLGKAYKQYPSRWARVAEWLNPGAPPRHQLHWVLRDINFVVNPGETVGIMGVNGAGKSTLLKMITGTTQPTTGSVHVRGRLAALLELGMGFHPEFTGRQNVRMAGQLMGFAPEEINALMPEIEAFADIGEYIDQPVRVYSSGMQVRLAFSVATAKRPEILIVDEALSVGDAAFQRKCFRRIESYRDDGTTLLLVSHDVETVKKICDQALLIRDHSIAAFGPAKQVCDEYERYLFGNSVPSGPVQSSVDETPPACLDPSLEATCALTYGNGNAEIEACWLTDLDGRRINVVESGSPFHWRYRVRFKRNVTAPIFAMMLKTREGVALYGVDSKQLGKAFGSFRAGDVVEIDYLLNNPLAPSTYYLNCGVRLNSEEADEFICRKVDAAIIRVVTAPSSTVATGLVELQAELCVC